MNTINLPVGPYVREATTYTEALDEIENRLRNEVQAIVDIWGYAETARQIFVGYATIYGWLHRGRHLQLGTLRDIAKGIDTRRA